MVNTVNLCARTFFSVWQKIEGNWIFATALKETGIDKERHKGRKTDRKDEITCRMSMLPVVISHCYTVMLSSAKSNKIINFPM